MWKNILIAYDGSEYANQALAQGCELAVLEEANISILSVVRLPEPMLGLKPEVFIEDATKFYKDHFEAAIKKLPKIAQNLELNVVVGRIAESLINFSLQNKIDLLVIGFAKKKPLLDKLILGSVAKQVLDNAQFSVLLVR